MSTRATIGQSPLPPLTAMFERYREKEDLREATFSKGSGYPRGHQIAGILVLNWS